MLADNVVPLNPGSAPEGAWDDVEVRLPPRRPRIAPGRYQARSVTLRTFQAFGRPNIELGLDIYTGEWSDGVVLARIPLFLRYSRKGISPQSKLGRLVYLLGHQPTRHTTVNLSLLRHKLWLVDVGDVGPSDELAYSIVTRVLKRLT